MVYEHTCKRCGQTKPAKEFYYNQQGYKISPYCKPCKGEIDKEKKEAKRFNEDGEELFSFGDGDQIYNYQKMWR